MIKYSFLFFFFFISILKSMDVGVPSSKNEMFNIIKEISKDPFLIIKPLLFGVVAWSGARLINKGIFAATHSSHSSKFWQFLLLHKNKLENGVTLLAFFGTLFYYLSKNNRVNGDEVLPVQDLLSLAATEQSGEKGVFDQPLELCEEPKTRKLSLSCKLFCSESEIKVLTCDLLLSIFFPPQEINTTHFSAVGYFSERLEDFKPQLRNLSDIASVEPNHKSLVDDDSFFVCIKSEQPFNSDSIVLKEILERNKKLEREYVTFKNAQKLYFTLVSFSQTVSDIQDIDSFFHIKRPLTSRRDITDIMRREIKKKSSSLEIFSNFFYNIDEKKILVSKFKTHKFTSEDINLRDMFAVMFSPSLSLMS